jgi:ArsR family transcriptional regulator, arsenate/arsenite/antimonite-responsive transcriptional repressor
MGLSKSGLFTDEQNETAGLLKALAHPARIAIIEYLLKEKACVCGDIVNALPLAQPTISQHLKELKNANIIKGSIEGTTICYCLNERAIENLKTYFSLLVSSIGSQQKNYC